MAGPPFWVIIADDLTGACDAGASFAGQGWETRVGLSSEAVCTGTAVWAWNTNSRMMTQDQAVEVIAQTAHDLITNTGSRFYKKIDSTMRGHPGAELAALMKVLGTDRALICPAFPQQQRVVRSGRVFVRGVPLGESEFAVIPGESDLKHFFSPFLPCRYVTLEDVRRGAASVSRVLEMPGAVIADAETQDDLRILAEAGERAALRLYCGSAGLGRALASVTRELGADTDAAREGHGNLPEIQSVGSIVIVVGSRSKASINQAEYLQAQGVQTICLSDDHATGSTKWDAPSTSLQPDRTISMARLISPAKMADVPGGEQHMAARLAGLAKIVMENNPAGGIILTGGDTAAAVCRALDCSTIQILGEVQPGLGWGMMVDGTHAGMPVVTKAGGFGITETLMEAFSFLLNIQTSRES